MRLLLIFLSLLIFAPSAIASKTPWQEVTADATLRMLFSDVLSDDSRTMAALEIAMPQSSNTYWRVPGEAGIPLLIDGSASRDIGRIVPLWPIPRREILYGYVDYIYRGNLILPMEIEITGPDPRLDLQMMMGICSDVCVPVRVGISRELDFSEPDESSRALIDRGLLNIPVPWDMGENPIGSVTFDETADKLFVQIRDPAIDVSSMIITIGNEMTVFAPPQKSLIEGVYVFEKLGGGRSEHWRGQEVSVIFMSPGGPYEISQLLEFSD